MAQNTQKQPGSTFCVRASWFARTFAWLLGCLCMGLMLSGQACVASNLDNSFDLNNGGFFFGLFLFNAESGCRFDDGAYDVCQFGQ